MEFVWFRYLAKGENRAPAHLAINPNGKAPALEDGETKIWEFNVIMCHLAAWRV